MTSKKFIGKLLSTVIAVVFSLGCVSLAACAKDDEQIIDDGDTVAAGSWEYFKHSYTNTEGEAAELEYGLYIPTAYTEGTALPLITYIPDASYVGQAAKNITKASGPANWATDAKMSANPVFFLVFGFTETSSDILTEGTQGAQIVPVIDKVVEEYGMDETRLYLTGQSMGGITDFAINDAYPEKFAATFYLGCQPGEDPSTEELPNEMYDTLIASAKFANQKFVYLASRKDQKAPYGQDDVEAKLNELGQVLGTDYTLLYGLDHTDTAALNATIKAELDKGLDRNFFGYEQLTANGDGVAEHMQSFKYGYQIDAIFEWLLAQHL